ncbi:MULTISPECIES: UDP-glucose 4-epimerase family protein [unclassified Rhizobium]|uniref:UDP-glucose 4-epimerase family protein n=1 Tax=unclassified Rhizobium TaxID=2613769 RepID=UPI001AD987FB|nr:MULTISPECIES: SDR family oxidoreductase [unclassified Rhizobium]MBO9097045.1 SDR family oxidoreductase [Rhizobium sp. L58/93]MBO9134103.1 SDR family oxidoreductase [Rhizobium sp. B209b/85]MBO9167283.1 SDR family oxidoreductase [Rhizobium sp. L245/93]MBO9183242.1 SDR family oxidoreductase [Rhizobium sp. E27B/91]QXZ83586.1 SDR family oxidoreductase [Rhizobium sp. K1/93]
MILVTGATGFVGTALCADLTARGIASRPASRLPTSGFHPVGAIDARTDWTEALAGIDCVVHLAARVHVMDDTAADPLAAFRAANVDATLNLAHQAAAAGARRFIFVSSIKVNGEETAPGRPFTAADVPEPRDPYGLSKWEAEQALFDLGRQTGMDIVVIRPPLIYGPGVKANFASLMRLARRGLPLPFGLISNKRSLLFVGNLTDFIILCVAHPDAANRTFLVSDGEDLSIGQLIAGISGAMGRKTWLLPVPPRLIEAAAAMLGKGSAARRLLGSLQVDIGETRRITGWTPPFSSEQGLALTVQAFPG